MSRRRRRRVWALRRIPARQSLAESGSPDTARELQRVETIRRARWPALTGASVGAPDLALHPERCQLPIHHVLRPTSCDWEPGVPF
jgi:hypothetical protein